MKKLLFLLLFLSLATLAFSKEVKPCTKAYCECPKKLAYYNRVCPLQFKAELNYLFVNFFENGLEFAQVADLNVGPSTEKQKFNSGARILFSFLVKKPILKHNYVDFTYTYINMKKARDVQGANLIYTPFLPPTFLNSSNAADSLSGNFNTFDLDLKRPYFVSRYYISSPSFGIRGAIIDQTYKVDYTISNTINNIKASNDYWGVGLKAGYGAEFIISKHYSFHAQTFVSYLFGKHDLSQKATTPINSLLAYEIKEESYSVLPNAQAALAFCFKRFFNKDQSKISLKVGYEFQEWWHQIKIKRFMDFDPNSMKNVSKDNLKFNSLTFSLLLDI